MQCQTETTGEIIEKSKGQTQRRVNKYINLLIFLETGSNAKSFTNTFLVFSFFRVT